MTSNPQDPKSGAPTLIVGAGPTGLTAAVELARRGHPVRVLEEKTGRPPLSKALAVNPRTLELLEPSGVTPHLLAAGWPAREIQLHAPSTQTIIRIDRLRHRYPFMLVLAQHRTETLLEERLAEEGVAVEKGKELIAMKLHPDEVEATFRTGGENSETVRAPVVFAADGAHSTARRLLKLDFAGETMERAWRLADVELETPAHPNRVHLFLGKLGPLFALRLDADVWRLISPRFDPREILPRGWKVHEVRWESDFKVQHRLLELFRKGPVFFGGDAAHLHSPFGARGMNLGIEDAAAFANALHVGRMEDYAGLRWAKAVNVVDTVRRASLFTASGHPLALAARNRVMPWVLKLGPAQGFLLKRLAGLK